MGTTTVIAIKRLTACASAAAPGASAASGGAVGWKRLLGGVFALQI